MKIDVALEIENRINLLYRMCIRHSSIITITPSPCASETTCSISSIALRANWDASLCPFTKLRKLDPFV